MEQTEADPGRTIVFISAGFDACEWEHQGMQRHDRRVPVSFDTTTVKKKKKLMAKSKRFRFIRGIRVILQLLRTSTRRVRLSPCWKAVTAIEL